LFEDQAIHNFDRSGDAYPSKRQNLSRGKTCRGFLFLKKVDDDWKADN
jgi:hypothetical protein